MSEPERQCSEDHPRQVEPGPHRIGALGQHDGGADEGQSAEQDVGPENGPPRPAEHQQAADERTECQPEAGHSGPDPEGPGPLGAVGIEMSDHRKGAGLRGRRADAHDHPAGDEDVGGGGDGGDHRAGTEHGHSEQNHLLAPEQVADGAEAEHQTGEGQGVAVHHPLELAHRRVQVTLHICQHHGHDGVVEEGQKEDEQECGQSQRP